MGTTIDRNFAQHLLDTFDDPERHGVHILFNQFWQQAPPEVADAYLEQFLSIPEARAFDEDRYYAEPMTIDRLAACPPGSLGEAAHEFIVANGLEAKLATNYRLFHQALVDSGMLDGLPEPLAFAVLRGFQLHDFLHAVTGYESTPIGEISLQAFCLAQTRFPYFSMWISVVTTRMTFLDPAAIEPLMDAIAGAWQFGRSVGNIQFARWEDRITEPLAELRQEYGIPAEGWRGAEPTFAVSGSARHADPA